MCENNREQELDRILVVESSEDINNEISEEIEIEIPLEFEKLISIDINELYKLCRICLNDKSSELISLLNNWDVETLGEMLTSFANVQLTFGDGLPESLCRDCVELLGKCYTFKQLCERSESMLRVLMNQGHLQIQTLKENEVETEHRTIIVKQTDEIEGYQEETISKDGTKSAVEIISQPLIDETDKEINVSSNLYNSTTVEKTVLERKMSSLSVMLMPSIDIEPRKKIKKHKSKKHKTAEDVDPIDNLKEESVDDLIKSEDILEIKEEKDDMGIESDHSVNDTSLPTEEEYRFQCCTCGKEFSSHKKLMRHEKTHLSVKPFSCKGCGKGFSESADLRRHERLHKRKEELTNMLQFLNEDKGPVDLRLPCSQCHLSFSSEGDLAIHQSVHMDYKGKKIICHHCKKQFDTTLQLKRHVRTHLSDKPYKCRICQKGFPEMSSLTRHFRRHTGETREKKHVCKHCDKAYHDRHSLNVHIRKHTGERPWICSECGKGFMDARLLTSHMKIHSDHKPFACTMCDKRFKHESTLTTHVRIHTGEKPYVCTVCGNAFIQSSNLALHMRSHTQERPYSCEHCSKKFTSSSALTTHRRIHTGEKPYSCNICQKKFARHDLSAHMRRHTGEKPHKCSVCSKKFTTIGQLNQHTRMHTGEKRFMCKICNKGCATSSYLKKHMTRTHNTTSIWQISGDIKDGLAGIKEEETIVEKEDIDLTNVSTSDEKSKELNKKDKKKLVLGKIDDKKVEILKTRIIDSNEIVLTNETAESGNFLNVVAIATSNGGMSILSQKNDLNLKGQSGSNINTIVASSEQKVYQIDPAFLRIPIQQIASVQGTNITLTKISNDAEIQEE